MKPGILLVNLGTPDAPTSKAVGAYLRTFLSDKRVVNLPAYLWQPLLYACIVPLRQRAVAKKYQMIWEAGDSPLRTESKALAKALSDELGIPVALGMRYGLPSIQDGLLELRAQGVTSLWVLPLFPQFSSATSASVFDAVTAAFKPCPHLPAFHFIPDYHLAPSYIELLAERVKAHWAQEGRSQKLIIFFHGLPQALVNKGDPYQRQCLATAQALAKALALESQDYEIAYQSRFGRAKWLQPYGTERIKALPKEGVKSLTLISPGFATDCLETLEELNVQYRELFFESGGEGYHYIPALNGTVDHAKALARILEAVGCGP